MCIDVSIEQYRNGWRDYTVVAEYTHTETGKEAIIAKSPAGHLFNTYNAKGSSYQGFWNYGETPEELMRRAHEAMTERGFILKGEVLKSDASALVTVQGRTLDEWEEQGRINATLLPEERIHPVLSTVETEDEKLAYVASMTPMEAALAMGVAGFEAQAEVTKKTRASRPRRQRALVSNLQ